VQLGVQTQSSRADRALDDAAGKANALIAALKAAGVAARDIQTTDVNVSASYDSAGHVTGFTAGNMVTAKTHALNNAGVVIDAAARAAGDAIRISSVSFSIENDSELVARARIAAVHEAAAHASQLTGAAGVHLGRIESIDETGLTTPAPQYFDAPAGQSLHGPTPIEPGTQQLSVDVRIVYDIDQ
jgi:uncharacterized protein YggE